MQLSEVSRRSLFIAVSRKQPCVSRHYQSFIQEHNICLIMHTLFCCSSSVHLPKQVVPLWFYNHGNILDGPVRWVLSWLQASLENNLLNRIGNQGRVDFLVDSKQSKGSPWKAQPVLCCLCNATLPCSWGNQLHLSSSTPTETGEKRMIYCSRGLWKNYFFSIIIIFNLDPTFKR